MNHLHIIKEDLSQTEYLKGEGDYNEDNERRND
jgi:hypothetical protein